MKEDRRREELIKLHSINSKRHRIIESIQAKGGGKHTRSEKREAELLRLKREREKIVRRLDKLNKLS